MTFWWIMLFVKHNIYGVQNGTVLYPFLDMLEYFQTKIQNVSIAISKNFSFPKLSRSWKMALSISNFPQPIRVLTYKHWQAKDFNLAAEWQKTQNNFK